MDKKCLVEYKRVRAHGYRLRASTSWPLREHTKPSLVDLKEKPTIATVQEVV